MIAHFDADAFFASVEQAADVRLRRRPVAVGGGVRGVICSASYEARAYGIHSAMPTRLALQRCPELCMVRGRFELYEQFSDRIFDIGESLTPYIERASIDEGYLDLRPTRGGWTAAIRQLRDFSHEISGTLKVGISCGLSARKRIAQIASKAQKPNGFTVVPQGSEADFLAPLDLGHLPGLGPVSVGRLKQIGLRTIADLAACELNLLYPLLGKQAHGFREMAMGMDDSAVRTEPPIAKSFGGQQSFSEDSGDEEFVKRHVRELLIAQLKRLRASGQCARTLTVALRYSDFETAHGSHSLNDPGNLDPDFLPHADALLRRLWTRRVRLNQVRVSLSQLYPGWMQGELFCDRPQALAALYRTSDDLNARFGPHALRPASQI